MSAISTYLEYIRSKIYAKDVRTAIVNAISQCYDDVNAPALQTEAMQAAVQAKIDAGEMAALTIADGSLTGAKLANGAVATAKIADGAITAGKLASDAVPTDTTLTQSGMPADAKKVGGEITNLKVDLDHLEEVVEAIEPGLSNEAKQALLFCFEHVAWTDEHGLDYYDVLEAALNGGSVDTLSAVVNLGTHVVYPTDNLQTLRDYLTVYFRSGGTTTEITAYVLQGDITSVGTHVLTITYNNLSTTVNITVEANTTGILYDWDFTKSLTDSRQLQTAVLGTGEAADIPGKSEGTTPPVRNETGIVFSDAQQFARLFSTDIITSDLLKNKTVEVDVASFDLQYTINVSYGMRFLMLSSPDTNGYHVFNCGLAYMRGFTSSYVLGWKPMSGAPDGTLAYPSQPIDTDISIINGHTVGVYFNNDGTIKMYIDGVSKGTSDFSVFAQDGCKGLQIGAGGRPNYGGCFYNALITGVRIYDGDAA